MEASSQRLCRGSFLLDVSVSRVWLSRLTALGNSNGLSQTDCPESGWKPGDLDGFRFSVMESSDRVGRERLQLITPSWSRYRCWPLRVV